jgi:hypothetical protein
MACLRAFNGIQKKRYARHFFHSDRIIYLAFAGCGPKLGRKYFNSMTSDNVLSGTQAAVFTYIQLNGSSIEVE